nr:hypothetical protein [uncultured Desulfuromonas sp.]
MIRTISTVLLISLAVVLLIDPWLHHHTPVADTTIPGLYVWISLGGSLLGIVLALLLSPLISRREDYYD